jgi:hypothetical protein
MGERKRGTALDLAAIAQDQEVVVEGEFSQRDDHSDVPQKTDLALKVRPAIGDLVGGWLVVWRSAANCGSDVGAFQGEAVFA